MAYVYGPYHYGAPQPLQSEQMRALTAVFEAPCASTACELDGRQQAPLCRIAGMGAVIVKHYRRGGILRHVVRRHYLHIGAIRSQREYRMLQRVRGLGIRAPEPLLYAYRGRLVYRNWLVCRPVVDSLSLARLSQQDPDRLLRVMPDFVEQLKRLVEAGVLHVDMHPGNVLVDPEDRIFLIDFDKSRFFRGPKNSLRRRYRRRWERAVRKYALGKELRESLRSGL
jgi:3-deoxy-D-manno-octulosonic acid kinase